jgi:hypothetical protein
MNASLDPIRMPERIVAVIGGGPAGVVLLAVAAPSIAPNIKGAELQLVNARHSMIHFTIRTYIFSFASRSLANVPLSVP